MLCANRIVVILVPGSANARRMIKAAKAKKAFFDLTCGRTTKAIILLEDGTLYGCALTPRTIAQRIQTNINEETLEEETEHEDHQSIGEVVDT